MKKHSMQDQITELTDADHSIPDANPVTTTENDLMKALTDAYHQAYVPKPYKASDPIPTELLHPTFPKKHSINHSENSFFASSHHDLPEDETPKSTFK